MNNTPGISKSPSWPLFKSAPHGSSGGPIIKWGNPSSPQAALPYLSNLVISFCVLAVLARSINLGFSEHVVRAEAVYSVLALSAFNAGPLAAKAIGVIPRKRKTEVMIEKKNIH